jgi:hypothetical protein
LKIKWKIRESAGLFPAFLRQLDPRTDGTSAEGCAGFSANSERIFT